MAGFGIVEAAQRARLWGPGLTTPGQRVVLAGIVLYTGPDSTADPTTGQLADWTGFTPRACRRIVSELVDLGVIVPVGERSKGRHATRWSITNPDTQMTGTNPDTIVTGFDSQPGPRGQGSTRTDQSGSNPQPGPGEPPTRTRGATNPDTAGSPSESSEISESARSADEEFRRWAERRAAERGGGPGLVRTILREDRHLFDAEQEQTNKISEREKCELCDSRGFVVDELGTPVDPIKRCDHEPRWLKEFRL